MPFDTSNSGLCFSISLALSFPRRVVFNFFIDQIMYILNQVFISFIRSISKVIIAYCTRIVLIWHWIKAH